MMANAMSPSITPQVYWSSRRAYFPTMSSAPVATSPGCGREPFLPFGFGGMMT